MEPTKAKKPKKLTKKQRGFVNDYVLDEHGTKAALNNYDTDKPEVANAIAVENLQKPLIIEAIEVKRKSLKQALVDAGINEDYLAQKVNVLLTATDEKGKTDFTAVDKGLKHALAINGVTPEEDRPKGNTYNILFNTQVQADIKKIDDVIKAQLIGKQDVGQT